MNRIRDSLFELLLLVILVAVLVCLLGPPASAEEVTTVGLSPPIETAEAPMPLLPDQAVDGSIVLLAQADGTGGEEDGGDPPPIGILTDPELRYGTMTSLEGQGVTKCALFPNELGHAQLGDVRIAASFDCPVLLFEDPSILKVTHVTVGGSLIGTVRNGSASAGLTWTERYGWGVTTTMLKLNF